MSEKVVTPYEKLSANILVSKLDICVGHNNERKGDTVTD